QGRLRHARRRGGERRGQGRAGRGEDGMTTELEVGLYIFMLAGFLGYHIITRVPPLLHTPLMSATNAIAAISLVGSLVVAGSDYSGVPHGWVCTLLGLAAVTCSSTNAVGGFLITDRMLRMFRTSEERARGTRQPVELQAFGFVLAVVGVVVAILFATKPAGMAMGEYLHERVAPEALRYCYILSAAMFVLGLKGLSSPRWARSGMSLAAFGMFVAVVGTLFHPHIVTYRWIVIGFAIGAVVGGTMGLRIPMTAVPQRTALSHSLGALAACLVGVSEYFRYQGALNRVTLTALDFEVVVGGLTFTGSLMAAAKLQELLRGRPITYRGQNIISLSLLSVLMCRAMNRSAANVLFGAFGRVSDEEAAAAAEARGTVRTIVPEETAVLLETARNMIVVPGYGMAVAQAQHAVAELGNILKQRGVDVRYAIHPVAGRMPGHMNVLLAEANVPYEQLHEMEAINPFFPEADIVLVVGANDVTNPAAKSNKSSPLYGMPILEVDRAKSIIVLKRSLRPGFAGVDNDLYYNEKCMMLFGD